MSIVNNIQAKAAAGNDNKLNEFAIAQVPNQQNLASTQVCAGNGKRERLGNDF